MNIHRRYLATSRRFIGHSPSINYVKLRCLNYVLNYVIRKDTSGVRFWRQAAHEWKGESLFLRERADVRHTSTSMSTSAQTAVGRDQNSSAKSGTGTRCLLQT